MEKVATWMYLLCLSLCCVLNLGLSTEVFTDNYRKYLEKKCDTSSFGYRCHFKCNCRNEAPCDRVTGHCRNGCKNGYWGPGCLLRNVCYYNGNKSKYMGRLTRTEGRYTCQAWASQYPQKHEYQPSDFPDKRYPSNYCRHTGDATLPWCYTTERGTRWGYCATQDCSCPDRRFGSQDCDKDCHCYNSDENCHNLFGKCQSGCAPGWKGFGCQEPKPCRDNSYGIDCGSQCHCRDPKDCERFNGPTDRCVCKEGFFNPPNCEAMEPPRIVNFKNVEVNPGRSSNFTCMVRSYPTPREHEVKLIMPPGRRSATRSFGPDKYVNTVSKVFEVNYVRDNERFTCSVGTMAGSKHMTMVAKVYELPRLARRPWISETSRLARNLTVEWTAWSKANQDMGDGPVIGYTVHYRHDRDDSYVEAGAVSHASCSSRCRFVLTNLVPNSKYAIYVTPRREGRGGEGPSGQVIHAKTKCDVPSSMPEITEVTSEYQYNTSYPKTKLMISWKDPPLSLINCNRIQRYVVQVTDTETGRLETEQEVLGSNSQLAVVENLKPATRYCVTVTLENDARYTSPPSTKRCNKTIQTLPTAPQDFKIVEVTSNGATLSWREPENVHGQIERYKILYWEDGKKMPKGSSKVGQNRKEFEFSLSRLTANTKYRVWVQAINDAGAGESSETLYFNTEEGVPEAVTHLTNISKTSNSIELQWISPDSPSGHIVEYIISCRPIKSLSIDPKERQVALSLAPRFNRKLINNLEPATCYMCAVAAVSNKGPGTEARVYVWTDPSVLTPPVSPVITKVTETTVTLKLHSSDDRSINYYRIIIERLGSNTDDVHKYRSRRDAPRHIAELSIDFESANQNGRKAYVAAQLDPKDLHGEFVVGDNRTYAGYFNGPLQEDQRYNVWFGAFSTVDGKHQSAFARADRPVVARSMQAAQAGNSLPVIIAIIVVFIAVLAILAAVLLMWRRRHHSDEEEKTDMPHFGPTILPEPDVSNPPTPIGMMTFPFAGKHSTEALIETTSTDILLDTEPVYTNIEETIAPIKVEDLWDYIREAKQADSEGLKREYKLLPAGVTATCEVARKDENKLKNRYGNIIAYDHTRVVLDPEGDDPHDDYINANYIDGYNKQRAYIAAQGPSKPTLGDIWRMVWRENSKTVIMLTNPTESGKKKCEKYWPDEGCEQYGNITVQFLDIDVLPDFTIRTFLISKGGQSKYVKQFHFTTWPDHGVPRFGHSLLLFRQKIRAYDSLDNGTLVIHCSAGVGRTGTYIAVDTQLERAKSEGIIDVHNFVQKMRTQRVNMVQTMEQYVFVYDCLLEALICGDTTVSSHTFPEVYTELCLYDKDIGKTKLEEQFEILKLLSTTIERDESTTALQPENIFKNRCKNIIPANRCRPYLMTTHDGSNDYINAVFLNSFCKRDQLLITQMPLPNTVVDFWRLIYDHGTQCIVMLNEVEDDDETSQQYWSEDPDGAIFGPFQVETTSEIKSNPLVTVRDFTISNSQVPMSDPHRVRQFHFHRWQEGAATPSSTGALLELAEMVEAWQQSQPGPVAVHCMNGASRSGLFCAALTILERLVKEKEVDVFQAIKQIRLNRSQLIDNMEQYRFCHDLVMQFLSNPNPMSSFSLS